MCTVKKQTKGNTYRVREAHKFKYIFFSNLYRCTSVPHELARVLIPLPVYRVPQLSPQLPTLNWGTCNSLQMREFLVSFTNFSENMKRSVCSVYILCILIYLCTYLFASSTCKIYIFIMLGAVFQICDILLCLVAMGQRLLVPVLIF